MSMQKRLNGKVVLRKLKSFEKYFFTLDSRKQASKDFFLRCKPHFMDRSLIMRQKRGKLGVLQFLFR